MKILEEDEKFRFIITILVCFVAIVVGLLTYADSKTAADLDGSKGISKDSSIGGRVKEYFEYHNLVNSDTLLTWNIDKSTIVKDNLYYVEGYYVCSNLSPGCVYQESYGDRRSDDSYSFSIYAYLDEDGDVSYIASIPRSSSKVKDELYKYFEENDLVDYSNLIKWNITSEKIVKNDTYKVYLFEGRYNCIDDKTDCIQLQEGNKEHVDGYDFKIYATFVEKDKELSIIGITKDI